MKIAIPSLLLLLAGCAAPEPTFTHRAPVADGGGGSAPVADGGSAPIGTGGAGGGGSAPVADGGTDPGTGGAPVEEWSCTTTANDGSPFCEEMSSDSPYFSAFLQDCNGHAVDSPCSSINLIGCCMSVVAYGGGADCYYSPSPTSAADYAAACGPTWQGAP